MLEARFEQGARGPVLEVLFPPAGRVRGAVLHIHPFAEELNKSRRMIALQARRLARAGWAVLLPDHYGCGDSGGDFADADWEVWLSDLCAAAQRLVQRYRGALCLWGLRSGCLLAAQLSDRLAGHGEAPQALIYWQPVPDGAVHLRQFLRLRTASGVIGAGEGESARGLLDRLGAGESLEVAGYRLNPGLARDLAAASLRGRPAAHVLWLEVVREPLPDDLAPGHRRLVDQWRDSGAVVDTHQVPGEPFWSTQEISEAPALIERTAAALERLAV